MNVWYDSGWFLGKPTYSSMLKVTTFLKLRQAELMKFPEKILEED